MNGAATYAAIGTALSAGGQMSDIVADPILNAGEPKNPAKNRQIISVPMLLAKPDPRMNSAKGGRQI